MRALTLVIAALVLSLILQISINYSILGYTIKHLFPVRSHEYEGLSSQKLINMSLELKVQNESANISEELLALASSGPTYLRLFPLEIYDGSKWYMGNLTLYPRFFKTLLVKYSAYSKESTEFEIDITYYRGFKLGELYILPLPQPSIMPLSVFNIDANATIYSDYRLRLFVTKKPVVEVRYVGTYDNPYPYGNSPLIMGKAKVSVIVEKLKPIMTKWYNESTISVSFKVKKLARKIYEEMENKTLEDLLNYIRAYLANTTKYTKNMAAPPKGKDLVEYFLFESKKGSCIAYSSAAAIILREIGIPARIVLGFIGEKQPNGQVLFKLSGHAWVEIYIPDAGWIPYDPTPTVGVDIREFSEVINDLISNLNAKYEKRKYGNTIYDRIVVSQKNMPKENVNSSLERLGRLERLNIEERKETTIEYVKTLNYLVAVIASVLLISRNDIVLVIRNAKKLKAEGNMFKKLVMNLMRNYRLQLLPYETPREAVAKLEKKIRNRNTVLTLRKALELYEELSFGGRRILEEKLKEIIREFEKK